MPEPTSIDPVVQSIDRATIAGIAQAALGASADLVDWRVEAINPGMGWATGAMYRFTGSALVDRQVLPWSCILKTLSLTASSFNSASSEIDHPLYWEREALAYQSGVLADLPGRLTAPRCLAVTRWPGDTLWLWLDEACDRYGPRWPLAQYASAARCLDRFNGAYLAGQRLPAHPWLCGPATLRGMLDHFGSFEDIIRDPQTWQPPLVQRAFPASSADRLLQLWADRAPLLDALERLPQTLCHKDAWRRNMFAPAGVGDPDALVMIDWASIRRGELGMDAGDLFVASYSLFGVEPCTPHELDRVVFENYLDGLRAAGWAGDWRAARFGYAAYSALKYGCPALAFWLRDADDPRSHARWERLSGRSMAEFVENQGRLVACLLDLTDEARGLLEAVVSKQSAVSSKQ
jgi:hypothetical protein